VSGQEVLVVCPPASGDTLARLLEEHWRVYPVRSVTEALEHLMSYRTSVVICESSLPDGTWRNLLESAPNLIVTARTTDETLWAEVLNLGGFDVLAQPFDEREVNRVVASAWRRTPECGDIS